MIKKTVRATELLENCKVPDRGKLSYIFWVLTEKFYSGCFFITMGKRLSEWPWNWVVILIPQTSLDTVVWYNIEYPLHQPRPTSRSDRIYVAYRYQTDLRRKIKLYIVSFDWKVLQCVLLHYYGQAFIWMIMELDGYLDPSNQFRYSCVIQYWISTTSA